MAQADRLGPNSKGRQPSGAVLLHSLCEQGELSQILKHDDSIIKIIPVLLARDAL